MGPAHQVGCWLSNAIHGLAAHPFFILTKHLAASPKNCSTTFCGTVPIKSTNGCCAQTLLGPSRRDFWGAKVDAKGANTEAALNNPASERKATESRLTMNNRITVAIIIPTYNRAQMVVQTLESVLSQSRPPDEILVVDDGSTDETAEVLAEYKHRIKYLYKSNGGLPSTLNYGLAATNADYIGVIDDDDLMMPDTIERHLKFLQAHPDIDFSYGGCYRFWSDTPPQPPYAAGLELYDCADTAPEDLFLRALETYPFHTQSMLVPLRCYRAIGGFDETRLRAEDYDMILRLARAFRGAKVGAPTFLLREHSGDRGPASERHSIRERDKVFLQYGRKLFSDLRDQFTLADYLPNVGAGTPLTNLQTRRALLQRACVMARHGLFDEALQDIGEATGQPLLDHPLTMDEQRMCSRMMDMDPMLLTGGANFLRKAIKLLGERAPPLSYACAKGFGWSISREFRRKRYRNAAKMAGALAHALGGRGLFSLMGEVHKQGGTPQVPH